MSRKSMIIQLLAVLVLGSCNKVDNYQTPNGAIFGKLVDKITNESLQTEQPNGFTVKLYEKGGQDFSPIAFSGKPDGTFENSWIFQNEYRVLPEEGAFFAVDSAVVIVGPRTEKNFDVMPFLALTDVNVVAGAGKISASYKIQRGQIGDKIVEAKILVSKVPTVNNIVFDFKTERDLSAIADEDILADQYADEVTGLASNSTYYVRIAARTDNGLKKYNYSKTFVVTVQ